MEQNKNYSIIAETQTKIIENLEKKADMYMFIAETYHLDNKKLQKNNQDLERKLKFHKKITIIATTSAILLGIFIIL